MIQIICPKCNTARNYEPRVSKKEKQTATCFKCSHSFKVYPKTKPTRIQVRKPKKVEGFKPATEL